MKILKIFGLVVGVHVIAFMFVFAIPGCRSTSRHSPPPPEAMQADRAQVRAAPPTPVSDGTNAPLVADNSSASSPISSAPPLPAGNPAANLSTDSFGFPVVHANPTRPGSPEAAGLTAAAAPTTTPATTYVLVSGDSLWKIAKKHGMTSKEIAAANNLRTDAPLREGQKLIIPGKAIPHSAGSALPTSNPADTLTYRVKSGETLAVIARHAGTTTAQIKSLNHLRSDTVRVGQELLLPAGGTAATTLATGAEESGGHGKNAGSLHHVVKSGETLGQIAKHYGVSRRELAVANNIADPLKLRAGQDLVIPGRSANSPKAANAQVSTVGAAAPETTPASTSAPTPTCANSSPVESPIAPATSSGQTVSPETSPIAPANPPVIQVQDSNSPVSSK